MFVPNQQIGLYKLIRQLGRGGFGEVWLAERRTQILTTKVAVKLPLNEQIDIETIKQEAELWEHASGHPNVLPIIEADIHDGQVLIVSEFAPDGSLADWLSEHGKMPVEQAIETTIKILDGLEFLHSRKIIHRDLKPANILLQGNTPRLADFGISRALRTTVTSQTQNVSGTFAYMPPEAFDGKRNEQTDLWTVGVNLYQFLTGRLPFPQVETTTLIGAIMTSEPAPLPGYVPQLVRTVLARALAKNPATRYRSAAEMRGDLRKVLRGDQQIFTPRQSTITEQKTIVRPFVAKSYIREPQKPKNNSYFGIAAILGLFIIIGAIALMFGLNSKKRETSQAIELQNVNMIRNDNASSQSANPTTLSNTNSFNSANNILNVNSNINANVSPTVLPTPDLSGAYQSSSGSKVVIRNVNAKGLNVNITAHSRCDAEASGRATWIKPYYIARFRDKIDFKYDPDYPELTPPEGESYCDTTLVFSGGKVKISETGNCSYFRGANCGFDGNSYSKK